MILDIAVGDVVELRKRHPCGGVQWRITRTGADIGLVCLTCGARVLLERPYFESRVKRIVSRTSPTPPCS